MTGSSIAVGVDIGGTFTDVALLVDAEVTTAKVPTTADRSVGVVEGIEKACATAGIDPASIDTFAHATTASVNALLERDGAKTALVTTAGFRDVLEIGRQDRPSLYDLSETRPDPLVPRQRRVEVDERALPGGVVRPPDPETVDAVIEELDDRDVESVAVCLLHAYATPENERVVADRLRNALEVPVSASHEVLAEFREYERTATTVADAYVTPVIRAYLDRLRERAADRGLPTPRIMRSNGGTADIDTVRETAVTTVLSGPAAGVIGAAASVTDPEQLITFDMGGTSSDISLVRDGEAERTTDGTVGGVPIRTPMVDVTTVGAGGGSIAWVDAGGAVRVGPQSAGADPGPACYDRGGTEPTVTDANVLLGYIGGETALGGELAVDVDAAREALDGLAAAAGLADAQTAAEGVYRVANAAMTRAIRSATIERGYDPRAAALVSFGGAGPMHATAIASALDITRVVVPPSAGVLSAFGLLAADEVHDAVRTVHTELAEADPDRLERLFEELTAEVTTATSAPSRATVTRAADCRYAGQSFELTVPLETADPDAITAAFERRHEQTNGYTLEEPVELISLRTTATVERTAPTVNQPVTDRSPQVDTRTAWFPDGGRQRTAIYDRERLSPGTGLDGPAVIEQTESTTVIPPGWHGTVHRNGALRIEDTDG